MADSKQNKPTKEDQMRIDEYMGKYKDAREGKSDEELWGTSENPEKSDPLPAKGLRSVGG